LNFHASSFISTRAYIYIYIYRGGRGEPGQDTQNMTPRTRQTKQDSQNRTSRIGQVEHDRQNRTDRTGQGEQNKQNLTGKTGQTYQDCQDRATRKVLPGHGCQGCPDLADKTGDQDRLPGQGARTGCQDRVPGQDSQEKTAKGGQKGKNSQ
jgi:hypothetical protein